MKLGHRCKVVAVTQRTRMSGTSSRFCDERVREWKWVMGHSSTVLWHIQHSIFNIHTIFTQAHVITTPGASVLHIGLSQLRKCLTTTVSGLCFFVAPILSSHLHP